LFIVRGLWSRDELNVRAVRFGSSGLMIVIFLRRNEALQIPEFFRLRQGNLMVSKLVPT
jgi:hypothetical protein